MNFHFINEIRLLFLIISLIGIIDSASGQAIPASNAVLPFDRETRSVLASSPKKVFAHWHAYPIRYFENVDPSIDTYSDWLRPLDVAGGRFRDRPLPRPPSYGNYMLSDYQEDIRTAAAAGLDAFMMNVWYGPEDKRWNNSIDLMFDASDEFTKTQSPGFSTAFNLDVYIIAQQLTAAQKASDAEVTKIGNLWADRMAMFKNRLSYFKIGGKHVVGFFYSNSLRPVFLKAFYERLKNQHKITPYFVTFNSGETVEYRLAVKPYIGTYGAWTMAPYNVKNPQQGLHDWAKANGARYAQSVTFTDNRPAKRVHTESGGFQTLHNSWMAAINGGADLVQLQTWNDHGEGHSHRPNTATQYVPLDLTAYYTQYFKTGRRPVINRDVVYYAHRMHLSGASPRIGPTMRESTNVALLDRVFALAFMKRGGKLQITSAGKGYSVDVSDATAAAGPVLFDAPLKTNDRPVFDLFRGSTRVLHFLSAFRIRSGAIQYLDLLYRAGSSSRPPVSGVQDNLPQERRD